MERQPAINLAPISPTGDKKFRFCYFKQALQHPSLDKEIKEKIVQLIDRLRSDGHHIDEIEFDLLDYIVPSYYVLTTAEASSNLSRYDGIRYGHQSSLETNDLDDFYKNNRSEGFGLEVKRRIMLGTFVLSTGYYDAYYSKAQKIRAMLVKQMDQLFATYDAVLMPNSPETAFEHGRSQQDPIAIYLADIYTVLANLTGTAGISLPLFSHSNNMPFGLQVITNKGDELTLLQISSLLMEQYTAHQRHQL
jgi:aspartyl-tRNA(Asn)/glutamyl-tRNA(Gln) amidotransferase subunit A